MIEKDYRMEEFRQVHDVIERMGVASLNQIVAATGLSKLKLYRSINKWVARGRLYRVGNDKYSVEEYESDPTSYKEKRAKLSDQRQEGVFLSDIFNKMVRVRDL